MNKEIIKILNELLQIPQSTNGEINFYSIESNKFEAIIILIKKQLQDLQHQLEEKQKIIDEVKEYIIKNTNHDNCDSKNILDLTDRDNLLEILERVKNGNS